MLDNYINNFQNIVSSLFFVSFKVVLIILVILLIFSLIILAIGTTTTLLAIKSSICFAESIGTAEVETAAIKMISNANNPQKRAESIGSLA